LNKRLIIEKNPRLFLAEHILKGDGSDGIPNVLSDDNVFAEGRRQTPLRKNRMEELMIAMSEDRWDDVPEDIHRNIQRNKTLIDLEYCPEAVKEKIINNFDNQDKTANRGKVMSYLIEKRCKLLLEVTGEFIND
jgi:hypothetical protein